MQRVWSPGLTWNMYLFLLPCIIHHYTLWRNPHDSTDCDQKQHDRAGRAGQAFLWGPFGVQSHSSKETNSVESRLKAPGSRMNSKASGRRLCGSQPDQELSWCAVLRIAQRPRALAFSVSAHGIQIGRCQGGRNIGSSWSSGRQELFPCQEIHQFGNYNIYIYMYWRALIRGPPGGAFQDLLNLKLLVLMSAPPYICTYRYVQV